MKKLFIWYLLRQISSSASNIGMRPDSDQRDILYQFLKPALVERLIGKKYIKPWLPDITIKFRNKILDILTCTFVDSQHAVRRSKQSFLKQTVRTVSFSFRWFFSNSFSFLKKLSYFTTEKPESHGLQ